MTDCFPCRIVERQRRENRSGKCGVRGHGAGLAQARLSYLTASECPNCHLGTKSKQKISVLPGSVFVGCYSRTDEISCMSINEK